MSRKPVQTAVMPERLIDFSDPVATNLGKKGTVMTGITGCSDGEAFVLMIDDVETGSFVLHSINQSGKPRTYEALTIPGYVDIGPATRFFVDEKYVAELASGRKVLPEATSSPDVQPGDLVILFKRDGSFVSAFPTPIGFEVKSLGVFENTGNVLLIGINSDDRNTRLVLLTNTGTEVRRISLFDDDPNVKSSKERQPLSDKYEAAALAFAQFVASGDDLLLVPSITSEPVLRLNENGVVGSTTVALPKGFSLDSVLDASATKWIVKTFSYVQQDPPAMLNGPMIVVNPLDGSNLGLVVAAVKRYRVVCEKDGTFLGLTTDAKTGTLLVSSGTLAP